MSETEASHAGSAGSDNAQQPEVLKTLAVSGIPCFNPKDDPNTLSSRWKRWKRAFMIYLTSKGVTSDKQKVALLLHTSGIDFQDVPVLKFFEAICDQLIDCCQFAQKISGEDRGCNIEGLARYCQSHISIGYAGEING